MSRPQRWLATLFVGGYTISAIAPIWFSLPLALAIDQPGSTLNALQNLFRPKRRKGGTRGPICLITPGLKPESATLSDVPVVLSDRPLLVWKQPISRVEVRLASNHAVVWNYTLPSRGHTTQYQGAPLQPGQVYQIVAFSQKNNPLNMGEDAQFAVMNLTQQSQINSNLTQQETELKAKNSSAEEIAIEQAIYLSKQLLLSDAFQRLYLLPKRSPQLEAFLAEITQQVCP